MRKLSRRRLLRLQVTRRRRPSGAWGPTTRNISTYPIGVAGESSLVQPLGAKLAPASPGPSPANSPIARRQYNDASWRAGYGSFQCRRPRDSRIFFQPDMNEDVPVFRSWETVTGSRRTLWSQRLSPKLRGCAQVALRNNAYELTPFRDFVDFEHHEERLTNRVGY